MIDRRTFVLSVIDQKKSLGINGIICKVLVGNSLLLNGTSFKDDDIAGYGRMHVHIHKEAEKPKRGLFFPLLLGSVIVMMVLAGMCNIRVGM